MKRCDSPFTALSFRANEAEAFFSPRDSLGKQDVRRPFNERKRFLAIAYPEELHLFYNAYSDCSQRVLLMLAEKGLDASLHPLNLLKAEQLSDWYRAITPKCEVPAIIHHGRAMHESC